MNGATRTTHKQHDATPSPFHDRSTRREISRVGLWHQNRRANGHMHHHHFKRLCPIFPKRGERMRANTRASFSVGMATGTFCLSDALQRYFFPTLLYPNDSIWTDVVPCAAVTNSVEGVALLDCSVIAVITGCFFILWTWNKLNACGELACGDSLYWRNVYRFLEFLCKYPMLRWRSNYFYTRSGYQCRSMIW